MLESGPLLSRAETESFPWEQVKLADVVYVSLGTLFNADASFYQDCFQAFADAPFTVIVSTGAGVKREQLGKPPANVIVASHVPQLEVLRRVRAFVTQGGMNAGGVTRAADAVFAFTRSSIP